MCSVRAVAELLTVEDALARVLAAVRPLESEPVALADASGRVLAEDARAAVDLPRFRSSAMDGFAVRAADTPGTLPVVAPDRRRTSGGAPTGGRRGDGHLDGWRRSRGRRRRRADRARQGRGRHRRDPPGCARRRERAAPRRGRQRRRRRRPRRRRADAVAARRARLDGEHDAHVRAPAEGLDRLDRDRAEAAGRAAARGRDLRVERADARRPPGRRGRGRRSAGARRGRFGRARGRARPRARRGRPRHLGRRVGRAARPRARHARPPRRRGGVLGRRDAPGQAPLVRDARSHARVRAAREPGLLAGRRAALPAAGGPRAPGAPPPRAAVRRWGRSPRPRHAEPRATTSNARRSSGRGTTSCSRRSRARSRT